MASASREVVRKKLAEILEADLVSGAPQVAQAVYAYKPTTFANLAPVVLVVSAGIARNRAGIGATERYRPLARLEIVNFVPKAEDGSAWTADKVEDMLDTIEQREADVILNNRRILNYWVNLYHVPDEFSDILPVPVGGKAYHMEILPIIAVMEREA